MSSKKVTIYSDGGADPNPGLGGWGAILLYGKHEKELSGNNPKTTNNRMELTAAIEALEALKERCEIEFYTDSQYVRRGITEWIDGWAAKNWVRKGGRRVENADLWQALWAQTKRHQINWHWVKGHAGDEYNERVDKLATRARLEITPKLALDEGIVTLYVRASCKGNPGPGGWGVILEQGGETEQFSGWVEETTNNRMELVGVLEGLRQLDRGTAVQLVTVSDYVYQGATNWIKGWRKRGWQNKEGKPTANADLWQQLDRLMAAYQIRWVNGKGSSLQGLIEAARLATDAVRQARG